MVAVLVGLLTYTSRNKGFYNVYMFDLLWTSAAYHAVTVLQSLLYKRNWNYQGTINWTKIYGNSGTESNGTEIFKNEFLAEWIVTLDLHLCHHNVNTHICASLSIMFDLICVYILVDVITLSDEEEITGEHTLLQIVITA